MTADLEELPVDVRHLLMRVVDSVEALEVLLHVARDAGAALTVAELAQQVGIGRGDVAIVVDGLYRAGLFERDGDRYRFAPSVPATAATVAELQRRYEADRSQILGALNGLAMRRLRDSAAMAFLRRDRGGGS